MEECSTHPGVYSKPGNECATCRNVREAEERAAAKAAKEAAKKAAKGADKEAVKEAAEGKT